MSPESEGKGTKKRHRRTAQEIERKYRCDYTNCGKGYGSEGALKMHIRLKHSGTLEGQDTVPAPSPSPTPTTPSTNISTTTGTSSTSNSSSPLFTPNSIAEPQLSVEVCQEVSMSDTSSIDYTFDSHNDFKELKARFCHIPLLRLNIGLWQAESQCCGDLVAKFCYKERTILWEIFDMGSLLRCVVSFDDLNGVGLELHPDDTATLVIELRCAPVFYKGVLQPHESTIWTPIGDFTEGMASTFRRHILHFSRRALNEPIEEIFRKDPSLQGLLLQGLPALKSPYFVPETVIQPLYYVNAV